MFVGWLMPFILMNLVLGSNGYCPDDEDLLRHRCICDPFNTYVECPSLPERCLTCFRYQRIIFNDKVTIFPAETFRFYEFFSSNSKQSMIIQFARIDVLSTNTFSKVDIPQNRSLSIKISQLTSPVLPTRLFEDLTVFNKGSFNVEIFNITSSSFIVEQYAFGGITLNYQSEFRFSILSAKDLIEFQSNAGSIMLTSFTKMFLSFSNFHRVILDEHSFDHITQEHASQFRLDFDRFYDATIEHRSFIDLHQLDQSQFHLTLSNFQHLSIEKTVFDSITQLNSSLIFSIYNLTNDLCLPSETFSHIEQDINSTFQFQVQYGSNLLFTNHSVMNITQRSQSTFSIVLINMFDIYFDEQSITYFHQEDQSLFDIWIRYGNNLIFEDNAIENIDIWRSSIMRIGFQYSSGALQIATNAFSDINEGQGGELVFQIMNSTDFYFRFNQSIRLEKVEILDRMLTNDDFCRISNIPSHIPMKLPSNQKCSCSVFFLYRRLHHTLSSTVLKDFVPLCYSSLSFDQIEKEEMKCSFDQQIHNCNQMQGLIDIEIPRGLCHHQGISLKTSHLSNNYSYSILIFIGVILIIAFLYLFSTQTRRYDVLNRLKTPFSYRRRQKLPIFSADSYQQLTQLSENHLDEDRLTRQREGGSPPVMKIVVKYNATTDQTQPHLRRYASDFLVTNDNDDDDNDNDEKKSHPNEDLTLKLNTNPLSDIEINP